MTVKDFNDLVTHLDNMERAHDLMGAQLAHLRQRIETIAADDGATKQLSLPMPGSGEPSRETP